MGCSASISAAEAFDRVIITVMGLPGTGKTSIIDYLAGEYDPSLPPIETIGISIKSVVLHDREFIFLDTNGLFAHQDEWKDCIEKSDGVILCFDALSLSCAYNSVKLMFTTVYDLIIQKNIPVLGIMTKTDNPDLQEYKLVQSIFEKSFRKEKCSLKQIKRLDDKIFDIFQWLEDNV
ncbi:hypothetical protein TVAG_374080 [Trichomonas vaginalis G3]|uniref:Small GTP-binding protein n=1 Tax=Trichomonas vaginalis (strain ATCC PRA-98 / G3) TaxID=412133 RepID=A2EBT9_TRIV3|nr:P-loop containing nucleoside triphosphate hydrolases family [Trichomonas vaginalis G3]EAY09901.1 hypothetical protein TVAG_374080 [Trichomonas vaginalis G3]KAI5514659.1 P-loop containing nucleoside triphosphate hydrolases family [Trichomonas vaginalis G3]|eukprot:XP_001322124.1 hypothetical protein [Trichomonas vaginalis G3]